MFNGVGIEGSNGEDMRLVQFSVMAAVKICVSNDNGIEMCVITRQLSFDVRWFDDSTGFDLQSNSYIYEVIANNVADFNVDCQRRLLTASLAVVDWWMVQHSTLNC